MCIVICIFDITNSAHTLKKSTNSVDVYNSGMFAINSKNPNIALCLSLITFLLNLKYNIHL